ncbi:hypothetical protein EDB85DRAFT_1893106 [Lactarius pseudohatsudake]|nr:hypothetical protein EDB85DRAFT_1893106 [Lactarius pseudohatsudake]
MSPHHSPPPPQSSASPPASWHTQTRLPLAQLSPSQPPATPTTAAPTAAATSTSSPRPPPPWPTQDIADDLFTPAPVAHGPPSRPAQDGPLQRCLWPRKPPPRCCLCLAPTPAAPALCNTIRGSRECEAAGLRPSESIPCKFPLREPPLPQLYHHTSRHARPVTTSPRCDATNMEYNPTAPQTPSPHDLNSTQVPSTRGDATATPPWYRAGGRGRQRRKVVTTMRRPQPQQRLGGDDHNLGICEATPTTMAMTTAAATWRFTI